MLDHTRASGLDAAAAMPNRTAAVGINQRPSKAIDLALALAQYGAGSGRLVDGDVER